LEIVLSFDNTIQRENVTGKFHLSSEAPSILLIRLSSLGDIVLTTSLIATLRERYPSGKIELVISKEYESLIPSISGLTHVHVFDKSSGISGLQELRRKLRTEQFDHVLDLHNVLRTKMLRRGLGKTVIVINKRTFLRWLLVKFKIDRLINEPDVIGRYFETAASLGVKDSGAGPTFHIHAAHDSKRIAIAPGSRHWNKRWPAEYFATVAKRLIENGYHIDIHGSEADRSIADGIVEALPMGTFNNYTGKLNLTEVASTVAEAGAIITNDSGLMHVAEAVGTKVIAIFGPTVKQFGFAPRNPNAVVLEVTGLYCRPCTAIGLDHCPEKHFRCMTEIKPEKVLHELKL
jgi:ADP-heptose:LPS heptosyltransferase